MKHRHLTTIALAAATVMAAFFMSACNNPTSPSDQVPNPTMANIWPHADGTRWQYTITFSRHAGLPPAAIAPELPSLDELHADLAQPVATDLLGTDSGAYSLRLDGDITTGSGVTAQNLVAEITAGSGKAQRVAEAPVQLLRALAASRPGNRAIAQALAAASAGDKSVADTRGPSFLGAMAFAYEDSGYYGYGDLNQAHSWVQLAGGLEEGREFSLQLVPTLADDVWLRGRIWSIRDRIINGRRWARALECMYVVDLGTQVVTDDTGTPLGYARSYWYGTVLYAPNVGPVACDERHVWGPSGVVPGAVSGGIDIYRCVLAPPVH